MEQKIFRKSNSPSDSQEIVCVFHNMKVHYLAYNSLPLVLTLPRSIQPSP